MASTRNPKSATPEGEKRITLNEDRPSALLREHDFRGHQPWHPAGPLSDPLHETPLWVWACGPGNFRTTGQNWTEEYVLYPAGLLQVPVVSFRKPGRIVGAW